MINLLFFFCDYLWRCSSWESYLHLFLPISPRNSRFRFVRQWHIGSPSHFLFSLFFSFSPIYWAKTLFGDWVQTTTTVTLPTSKVMGERLSAAPSKCLMEMITKVARRSPMAVVYIVTMRGISLSETNILMCCRFRLWLSSDARKLWHRSVYSNVRWTLFVKCKRKHE